MQDLIIEPGRREAHYWRDLWHFRELLYFLAWRDILVRYKQTVVGIAWAVLRPALTIAILTVVFGKVAKLPSNNLPYPLLVLGGMLPWQFFAAALTESGNSLVGNSGLISKIYFPRMIVPASSVITSVVDFFISCSFLIFFMAWYHFVPGPEIFALPFFVLLAFAASFGTGLWISALMVKYRDFRVIVPFVVQFGLYATPVAYLSRLVPEKWRLLYSLNPMVGIIDGFRWSILQGREPIYLPGLFISIVMVVVLITTGIWHFRKTERTFADVI